MPTRTRRSKAKRWERLLAVGALTSLLAAWVGGRLLSGVNFEPFLRKAFPHAQRFEPLNNNLTFAARGTSPTGEQVLFGYVAIGEATGYGGPLKTAVGVDLEGEIVGVAVVEHRETPTFFHWLNRTGFVASLEGKEYEHAFELGQDVDAVTGATYTAEALAEAVREASRKVAAEQLGLAVPPPQPKPVEFGAPEWILILLYIAGFVGHQRRFPYTKAVRWATMLGGLAALGFLYNSPLTLANINAFLMGFFPDWRSHLYWYLLLGGILFVYTVDNKNPYCQWFCPFGAAQECLGAIGGAKPRSPGQFRGVFRWLQRGLAWVAILLALIFRNPGLTSYEVFGTLFDLTGSTIQFVLLVIILLAALYIKRPWCTYLCPIRPVTDLIKLFRQWIFELWRERTRTAYP
jgi:uncharacterized protein with FMN-binding domain